MLDTINTVGLFKQIGSVGEQVIERASMRDFAWDEGDVSGKRADGNKANQQRAHEGFSLIAKKFDGHGVHSITCSPYRFADDESPTTVAA